MATRQESGRLVGMDPECPAGGPHVWVDDLTEAQLLTGLRPSTGWLVRCEECGETIRRTRSEP